MSDIARRIHERRKFLGLTQIELSKYTGISQAQISSYERAENEPNSHAVVALARGLEVSTDWLLGVDSTLAMNELTPEEQRTIRFWRDGRREDAIKVILG